MPSPTTTTVIQNATLLDVASGRHLEHRSIAVRGGRIVGFDHVWSDDDPDIRVVDARGGTVMPGLIDCHVHPAFCSLDMRGQELDSATYIALLTARNLGAMLMRGFTTVRDLGGVDFGIVRALEEGLIPGPRTFFCGKTLSQTGGHGDLRERGYLGPVDGAFAFPVSNIADGVAEVRRAARRELRLGADHIKIALSGGVGSQTDRIDSLQYSEEEVRAVVEEARMANRYVAAHAYTARAVNRALSLGVRTIEHGNFIDERSIELFLEHEAFYVPTLVTYDRMRRSGAEYGLPPESVAKLDGMVESGMDAISRADAAGVQIAFGTDLLGPLQDRQLDELTLRSAVQSNADVLRSATLVGARLLGIDHEVGQLKEGFLADLIVVDGDPLEDLGCLTSPERSLRLVMRAGEVFHSALD